VEQAGARRPSYDELAALVEGLVARVEALEAENAALKRRLGLDSTNSSTPPSQDLPAAKGKRRAQQSQWTVRRIANLVGSRAGRAPGLSRR